MPAVTYRVLLTGAAGFIGSHLARILISQGHQVVALVSPTSNRWRLEDIEKQMEIVPSDLLDLARLQPRLREARLDTCIHMAWHGWSGPSAAEQNLSSLSVSLELLKLMPAIGCKRFVAAGTCFEYDVGQEALSEKTPMRPVNLYGQCKKALHEVGQEFARITEMEILTARLFYTYGPYEDTRRVVPAIIRSLLIDEPARITPGMQIRDYLHVEDVASAIWASARSSLAGAVNIASGIPVRIAELANTIGDLMGKPELIELGAIAYRENDPMRVVADASVLRDQLGWAPTYTLSSGLTQTIDWWRVREQHSIPGAR